MLSLILLGAAGFVAGSPAPAVTGINLAVVTGATAPDATGPAFGAINQTSVYNAAAASSSAVAAVTGVATASGTAPSKRSLEERTFCLFGICIGGGSSGGSGGGYGTTTAKTTTTTAGNNGGGYATTTVKTTTKTTTSSSNGGGYATTTAKTTTTSSNGGGYATTTVKSTSPVTTSTAPVSTTTAYTPYYPDVPTTCTPVSWTNTNAFTSETACPTPFEVGTYCGFINPEDPCAPQPDGYAPVTTPDTDVAFLANPVYHNIAKSAVTPKGYDRTFVDQNASSSANSYMGLYTMQTYDVQACADKCDSTDLCTGFNFYIERDPMWNPDQCSCTGTNTSSIAAYKCTLWGSGVELGSATNTGGWRDGFHVVIAGSNGYEKTNNTTPVTPPGWTNPQKCSGVHDHPSTCISEKLFPGVFDVSICATYATQQNAVNVKSGILATILSLFGYNPGKCNFFNAFMLTQDGKAQGTYCKLFAQQYSPSVGNVIPGWSGSHFFGVESSWSFCSS